MDGMEAKKSDSARNSENSVESTSSNRAKTRSGVVDFGREIKQELKKIEWTTKDELKSYTKIVVISTFLFGMGVYFIDLIVQTFLSGIHLIFKFLTG
jgi:preprotein translocase subunit SecE